MRRYETASNPICATLISGVNIPGNQGFRPNIPPLFLEFLKTHDKHLIFKGETKTCSVQTRFRECETQTDPFSPEIETPYNPGLEVLTLSWLSWNNGLPAGMREVTVIERARQKRAWERALPVPTDPTSNEIQKMILEAIELNEWNYRETELAALANLRMELARKCLQENLVANRIKYKNRLFKYVAIKSEEKHASLQKARVRFRRNLRRLTYSHNNINRRYYRWNVVQELHDKTSEFYGPQQRFGVHPRRAHEIIPQEFRFWNVFSSGDIFTHDLAMMMAEPKKQGFDYIQKSKPRQYLKQLCIRETKWTVHELQKLHYIVRVLRRKKRKISKSRSLKQRIERFETQHDVPAVPEVADDVEEAYQAAVDLQKIIKGRAIQAVMFEGRVRCQELIDELKSTHALQKNMEDIRAETRRTVYIRQRRAEMKALEEKRKNEILLSLEGKTVADILDFLSKELIRIQNERETHAIALMADKARHEKEAAEAGRRQKEEERNREHEEMWRQICKVYQNSSDAVSQDLVLLMQEQFSNEEARKEAEKYAKNVDLAASEAHLRRNELEEEEIVADLVYNFALPHAEKEMVRSRLKAKQKSLLTTCHDEIYSKMESVARGKRSPSGTLLSIPRPRARKREKVEYITYLELAKQSGKSTSSASKESSFALIQPLLNGMPPLRLELGEGELWSTGYARQEVVID